MGGVPKSVVQRWPRSHPRAACVAVLALAGAGVQAQGDGLTIYPVNIELASGQRTAALTVQNHTDKDTAFQIRAFAWSQDDSERLVPTDALLVSPPLGTLAAGKSQVVRLVLRDPAQGREVAFRILFDQIQPPPAPGAVNFALRLSIPVFAEPPARVFPHIRWSVEGTSLVAVNDGGSHETVRNITIATPNGRVLRVEQNLSPYVLGGATRRWRILTPNNELSSTSLRLKAQADSGAIDQPLTVRNLPP